MAKVIKNLLVGAFLFLVVYMVRTFNIKILNVDFYDPLNLTVDFFASLLVAIVIAKIINVTPPKKSAYLEINSTFLIYLHKKNAKVHNIKVINPTIEHSKIIRIILLI